MKVSESKLMRMLAELQTPKATVLRSEQVSDKQYKSKGIVKHLGRLFDEDDSEI